MEFFISMVTTAGI